ncbi:MAG: hypothetical protein HOC20_01450, partial [Chloroflexi bacterium]|nr:hypothetical protein [Chloroflexota bacterium]
TDEWIETGEQLPVTDAQDMSNLPMTYMFEQPGAKKRKVSINTLVPTRGDVNSTLVQRYVDRTRITDRYRQLPFGVKFRGSNKIYVLDGNHRLIACRKKKRKRLNVIVNEYDITLDEALRYEMNLLDLVEIANECPEDMPYH